MKIYVILHLSLNLHSYTQSEYYNCEVLLLVGWYTKFHLGDGACSLCVKFVTKMLDALIAYTHSG